MSLPPTPAAATYAGQRLGLPEAGRGSVASWGRRILALCVDWFASILVAGAIVGPGVLSSHGWEAWMPLLVFLVEGTVLTPLVGGSFGQLLLRVAVVRLDRRPVNLLVALLRTLLICLVVPPVIYNRDRRGLHDLVAGTVTVRR
ncbi:RDD family protein [Nocardioides panacis]|uniref:RDD family protein n=1 Tax=Nocardioides panacis TaxID=2849501 RepID=A0A975SV17_9ACTN|nr:RDD family protein [Nocardioides panacis]QWZ06415.1 RDD family protein [Nocardioides panacis]